MSDTGGLSTHADWWHMLHGTVLVLVHTGCVHTVLALYTVPMCTYRVADPSILYCVVNAVFDCLVC